MLLVATGAALISRRDRFGRSGASARQLHREPLLGRVRRAGRGTVDYVLDMAEIPTFQQRDTIDTQPRRSVLAAELAAVCAPALRHDRRAVRRCARRSRGGLVADAVGGVGADGAGSADVPVRVPIHLVGRAARRVESSFQRLELRRPRRLARDRACRRRGHRVALERRHAHDQRSSHALSHQPAAVTARGCERARRLPARWCGRDHRSERDHRALQGSHRLVHEQRAGPPPHTRSRHARDRGCARARCVPRGRARTRQDGDGRVPGG